MPIFDCTDSATVRLVEIPSAPGVYIFRNVASEVLYVGKARELRKRLASYFRRGSGLPARTAMMLRHASTFECIVTPTEKEALILEATLIKKHRPRYNIVFRDDKAYPFLRITIGEPWPRLGIVRKRRRDKAHYFGPYPSSGALRDTVRLLTTTFGIRTCTTRAMKNRPRACLQFQIGKCSGPCAGAISMEDYRRRVQQVLDFFSGRSSGVISQLRQDMNRAAEQLEFEKAARIRDQIKALEKLLEKQSVVSGLNASWDCVGIATEEGNISVAVLRVREGVVSGCETRRISMDQEYTMTEVLQAFLMDFFQDAAPARDILLPVLPENKEVIEQWLSDIWGYGVRLSVPARGDRRRLLQMASDNASRDLEQMQSARRRWDELSGLIAAGLDMKSPPCSMECVDISTTGGELSVGSLVAFKNGTPWKQGFRIYNIRDVQGVDDFAMIHEVVRRRMERAARTGDLPDLLLIDGGRGQLAKAVEAVTDAGFDTELFVISIAKERASEGEKIYFPHRNTPLILQRNDPVLLFLQRMRDEAHRFGITAHRNRRDRQRSISGLSDIPGIGAARQRQLLETFGSMSRVKDASISELEAVKGLPSTVARRIFDFFHGQNT